jgi:cellulose synthase/poly-beta-1,6-N-acetylglucosamine synthase-like glycosyltransferase
MKAVNNKLHKIAIVVFACNESGVIQDTILSIQQNLRMTDDLFVIADNCTDNTAQIASQLGAKVYNRVNDHNRGKGAAISWFVMEHQYILNKFDQIVILDADSLLPVDFLEKLESELDDQFLVGQCFLNPVAYKDSPLSTLIALSELVEQTIFDRIRLIFGFSVRLRGTGMVFNPRLLYKLCSTVGTEVEDIVFSLLLAEQKIIVKSFTSAIVYDPKPTGLVSASKQRARWFRGQNTAFWKYRNNVKKVILSGMNGWSVLASIFFKPRWLKLILLAVMSLICLPLPVISSVLFGYIAFESILILIGTFRLQNRIEFLKSLFYLPIFLLMWLYGIQLSFKHLPWLRVRNISSSMMNCGINSDHFVIYYKGIK